MARPLTPALPDLRLQSAWAQITGQRKEQQDAASITCWENGFTLLVLADGMGGHVGGAAASRITIEAMKAGFMETTQAPIDQRLLAGLQKANDAMFDHGNEHPELDGLGATVVAVTFDGDSIDWISVGDSPLWLIRDGAIARLNADHSMKSVLAEQVSRGEISAAEARESPDRSQLLEAVMGNDIELVDQPEESLQLQADDLVILASDGLESLTPAEIVETIQTADADDSNAAALVDRLLAAVAAVERPGQDNATVVLARVTDESATPSARPDAERDTP